MRNAKGLALPIEIDGGVHRENLAGSGAGRVWIGSSQGRPVFHSKDVEATVREMREIAAQATTAIC